MRDGESASLASLLTRNMTILACQDLIIDHITICTFPSVSRHLLQMKNNNKSRAEVRFFFPFQFLERREVLSIYIYGSIVDIFRIWYDIVTLNTQSLLQNLSLIKSLSLSLSLSLWIKRGPNFWKSGKKRNNRVVVGLQTVWCVCIWYNFRWI